MGLQPSKLEEAKTRILKALDSVRTKKIPIKELNEVKNYIKGTFILDHQTNSQRAHYLGWWKILGLGSGFDRQYIKEVDKVTSESVLRAAKKVLNTPSITVEIYPKKLSEGASSPFRERGE
jgi:predicted Zn-dependent peptidase